MYLHHHRMRAPQACAIEWGVSGAQWPRLACRAPLIAQTSGMLGHPPNLGRSEVVEIDGIQIQVLLHAHTGTVGFAIQNPLQCGAFAHQNNLT